MIFLRRRMRQEIKIQKLQVLAREMVQQAGEILLKSRKIKSNQNLLMSLFQTSFESQE